LHLLLKMGKRKAKRQKVTVEDTTSSVDLEEGWVTKLLELPEDELAGRGPMLCTAETRPLSLR